MKRVLIATFTVISLISPVLALTEAEVEAQVAAQGKEAVAGTTSEFAMYNADQYRKPDGAFTVETATDGSEWYKQTAVDTVQKTPYMDAGGEIKYKQEIVQKLPQIPRRKDKV